MKGTMMRLLIKSLYNYGLAAHIPTPDGNPLCCKRLRRIGWYVVEINADYPKICRTCQRRAAQQGLLEATG
jgi:hypothetical protein